MDFPQRGGLTAFPQEQGGSLEECALALSPAQPPRELPQVSLLAPRSMLSGRLARQVARVEQQRFADTRGDQLELRERQAACAGTKPPHRAALHALVVPASLSRLPVPPALWRCPPSRLSPGAGSGSLCSGLLLVHKRPDPGLCAPGSRGYERIRPYTPVPCVVLNSRHTAPSLAWRLLARA